jgi:hypothetical protein
VKTTYEKSTEKANKYIPYINNEEHIKLRNSIHQLEKEKIALADRLHNK